MSVTPNEPLHFKINVAENLIWRDMGQAFLFEMEDLEVKVSLLEFLHRLCFTPVLQALSVLLVFFFFQNHH